MIARVLEVLNNHVTAANSGRVEFRKPLIGTTWFTYSCYEVLVIVELTSRDAINVVAKNRRSCNVARDIASELGLSSYFDHNDLIVRL